MKKPMDKQKMEKNQKCIVKFLKSVKNFFGKLFQKSEKFDLDDLVNNRHLGDSHGDNLSPREYLREKIQKFLTSNWFKSLWSRQQSFIGPEPSQVNIDVFYKNPNIEYIMQKNKIGQKDCRNIKKLDYENNQEDQENQEQETNEEEEKQSLKEKINKSGDFNLADFHEDSENDEELNKEGEAVDTYEIQSFSVAHLQQVKKWQHLTKRGIIRVKEESEFKKLKKIALRLKQNPQYFSILHGTRKCQVQQQEEGEGKEEDEDYLEEYQLILEEGYASIGQYVDLLRNKKKGWDNQEREITYIFKKLISMVYALETMGLQKLGNGHWMEQISLFLTDQQPLVKNQYEVKLRDFSNIFQVQQQQDIEDEDLRLIFEEISKNGKYELNEEKNAFLNETERISYQLQGVARTIICLFLNLQQEQKQYQQMSDAELMAQFTKNCKKNVDQKIFNVLSLILEGNQSELNENRLVNSLPNFAQKCLCELVKYSDKGVQIEICQCKSPLYVSDNKEVLKVKQQLEDKKAIKNIPDNIIASIDKVIQLFLNSYNQHNFEVCKEILQGAISSEKVIEVALNGNNNNSDNCEFLIKLAHLAAQENYVQFSKNCQEKAYECYQKETQLHSTQRIEYLAKQVELISYYLPSAKTPQDGQQIFNLINQNLHIFADMYSEGQISQQNAVQIIYNIIEAVDDRKFEIKIYFVEIIEKFEVVLNNPLLQGQALLKLVQLYARLNYLNQETKQLDNYADLCEEYLEKAQDLFEHIVQDKNNNIYEKYAFELALEGLSEVYIIQSEIYRKQQNFEKCYEAANNQVELAKKNRSILIQIDAVVTCLATHPKKQTQTQGSIRNWLQEIQKIHADRKSKNIVKKYPDVIYPLDKYIDLLIGASYFYEGKNTDALVSFEQFHKYANTDQKKYENFESFKSIADKLPWKSWIYYLKFMAQCYFQQKDYQQALQLQGVYNMIWEGARRPRYTWISVKFSNICDYEYFKISAEQEIYDLMNLTQYQKYAKHGQYSDRIICECMNMIFFNSFQEKTKISDQVVRLVLHAYIEHVYLVLRKVKKIPESQKFKNFQEACEEFSSTENPKYRFHEKFYSKLKQYVLNQYLKETAEISSQLKIEYTTQMEMGNDISSNQNEMFGDINQLLQIAEGFTKEEMFQQGYKVYTFIDQKNKTEQLGYSNISFVQFKATWSLVKHLKKSKVKISRDLFMQVGQSIKAIEQTLPEKHILKTQCMSLFQEIEALFKQHNS